MQTNKRFYLIFSSLLLAVTLFFASTLSAKAMTFHWIQTAWTASSTDVATHLSNRNDWTLFFWATSTGTTTGNYINLQMYSNGVD